MSSREAGEFSLFQATPSPIRKRGPPEVERQIDASKGSAAIRRKDMWPVPMQQRLAGCRMKYRNASLSSAICENAASLSMRWVGPSRSGRSAARQYAFKLPSRSCSSRYGLRIITSPARRRPGKALPSFSPSSPASCHTSSAILPLRATSGSKCRILPCCRSVISFAAFNSRPNRQAPRQHLPVRPHRRLAEDQMRPERVRQLSRG